MGACWAPSKKTARQCASDYAGRVGGKGRWTWVMGEDVKADRLVMIGSTELTCMEEAEDEMH